MIWLNISKGRGQSTQIPKYKVKASSQMENFTRAHIEHILSTLDHILNTWEFHSSTYSPKSLTYSYFPAWIFDLIGNWSPQILCNFPNINGGSIMDLFKIYLFLSQIESDRLCDCSLGTGLGWVHLLLTYYPQSSSQEVTDQWWPVVSLLKITCKLRCLHINIMLKTDQPQIWTTDH